MTNCERNKHMLTDNLACPSCGTYLETVIHVLRDSVQVWDRVIPPTLSSQFFTWDLRAWIVNNLKQEFVFFDIIRSSDVFLRRCTVWEKYYANYIPKSCRTHETQQTLWSKPPASWMCLNSDGAVPLSTGGGSIGGAIHDSNGWFNNSVPNRLAKLAPATHFDLMQYVSPHLQVIDLLARDSSAAPIAITVSDLD
ncbi:uncharacterized protein LOC120175188 [Hibiscus syriacus]|uniref:uncharacterized protein LOC120175188 n=1 Tax=Hibiscus syriacus TaxID=106335 RepID=UPI0019242B9A|nr:uncharacterized protein LOC120175188 [Hibiscus syriacus]